MNSFKAWKSGEGRLSRKGYALYFLTPGAGLLLLSWLAMFAAPDLLGAMSSVVFVLPWMFFLITTDAQNIRRYHDIGHSGRLYRVVRPLVIVMPVLALVLNFVLPAHMAMAGDMQALVYMMGMDFNGVSFGPIPMALLGLTLAVIACNVVYLTVMPGTQGPNDFGPDPNTGASAGVKLPGFGAEPAAAVSNADDPVKRALAQYQAQQQKHAAKMATPVRNGPAGASFGRKRT